MKYADAEAERTFAERRGAGVCPATWPTPSTALDDSAPFINSRSLSRRIYFRAGLRLIQSGGQLLLSLENEAEAGRR